jgi:hypothetical protein
VFVCVWGGVGVYVRLGGMQLLPPNEDPRPCWTIGEGVEG